MLLSQLQKELKVWQGHNFPNRPSYRPLLGAVEEIGELAHAHLKQEQGIRGLAEEHEVKGKDAVGDTIIFLADYCNARGWDMGQILTETWDEVKLRDWQKNKETGK